MTVCEACRDLAMVDVNRDIKVECDDEQPGPSQRGHTNGMLCGCSILQRQSDKILRDNPTELHQLMYNIIQGKSPRQITVSDRVCHACWLRTQREARRKNTTDNKRPLSAVEVPATAEPAVSAQLVAEEQPAVQNGENRTPNKRGLILPNYRRAANNNNRCVFPGCHTHTLRSISDKLRAMVLSNHRYYLPKLARVCSEHLICNSWEMLYDSTNSMDTFTAEQIQHVFSFVNAFNQTMDFENVLEMDDSIFEYLIGLTKEKFNNLLQELPQVTEVPKGCLGLAALLLKMRMGDSDERIAALVRVPRRTLENLMSKIRELVMLQDVVPRKLDR